MEKSLAVIQEETMKELADPEVFKTLLATTFKGLTEPKMKEAIMDGIIRGFTFKDFRERNVYAIPFNNRDGASYSLVTSIDYSRKVAQKAGILGMDEPIFEEKDGKIVSCSITVKRKVGKDIGTFTAKVYFDEYNTGANQWAKRPRTMIAKVAEMHALRKACPEVLSQQYVEEEMTETKLAIEKPKVYFEESKTKLRTCKNLDELKSVWSALPVEAKENQEVVILKEDLKLKFIDENEKPSL
jgi:hypothetical protein